MRIAPNKVPITLRVMNSYTRSVKHELDGGASRGA